MYVFAYICLLIGLLASLGGGGLALLQLWQRRTDHLRLVSAGQWLISLCLCLASAILLHALFWHDYRLEYVASYTDSFLPVFYRLTAFWAGQPGSMLFWALATALAGLVFSISKAAQRLDGKTALWFWCLFYANMAFFCLVLTSWSNPFIMAEPVPQDGNGLNPLLQNPGMIFHPPLLFMGYAGFTVPACLALAQLQTGFSRENSWFGLSRAFILVSWLLLTAGIILGAWWAYMELGWGGYWAWDPVENASLLPWLVATAAIHILAVEKNSGKLPKTGACLMAFCVIAAFFATYLTRSGVIQSVHAFGDGGVGTPLLLFVAAASLVAILSALLSRQKAESLAQPLSREGLLVLAAWIFLALAVIILIATMWPVFSKIGADSPQGLDAAFYNRVCLPLGVALLILMAGCSWVGWHGGFAGRRGLVKFMATCGSFIAAGAAFWGAGYKQPLALAGGAAAVAAICAMSMHSLDRAVWRSQSAFSAFTIHFGLAVMALGISFSGSYSSETDLMLATGQSGHAGNYEVTLEDVKDGSRPGYDYLRATLLVSLGQDKIGIVTPERRIYAKFGTMQFSEVDVLSSPVRDIYASLLGIDEDYRVKVRITIEPLVGWIWVGGAIICLMPIIGALIPAFARRGKKVVTGRNVS